MIIDALVYVKMDVDPSTHWNSLFDSIKPHIPSIDSESSSSENEEDIPIFRRPVALLPKHTEGLECLSLEDSEIEELLISVAQPQLCWTEETLCPHREPTTETHGAYQATDLAQQGTHQEPSPIGNKVNEICSHNSIRNAAQAGGHPCSSIPVEMKGDTSAHHSHGTLNRQKTTESTSPHPSHNAACEENTLESLNSLRKTQRTEPNGSMKKPLQNSKTVLSFEPLEHWDLDQILLTLQTDRLFLGSSVSDEPVEVQPDGDNVRSQDNILERLAAFCRTQCGDDEDKIKTAPDKTSGGPQKAPVQHPTDFRQNGGWRKSFKRMAFELQPSRQEAPTVYIDLRNPEPPMKTTRPCNSTSSQSMKLTNSNLHDENPSDEKTDSNIQSGLVNGKEEVTGKSLLLRMLREANRNRSEPDRKDPVPADSTCRTPRRVALKDKLPEANNEKTSLLPEVDNQTTSPTMQRDQNRQPVERTPAIQQSATTGQPKKQSDREQKEQQKQRAQRKQRQQQLQKHLESFRPTRSAGDREPAAEKTDVLYDTASHLQSVNTLPADMEDKECLLLTVCLSSPGLVASSGHHWKAPTVESATTKSHIYNALVAWFLSLVGAPGPQGGDDRAAVPFWVAGLQQLWTEDGLALHICAVSHGESLQLGRKPRKRGVDKGRSVFQQRVCRFLSQTSLSAITHWLPQLRSLLDQQAYPPTVHIPASCLDSFISVNSDKMAVKRTFGLNPGFYWQTVETQELGCQRPETMCTQQLHTEIAVTLGYTSLFLHPLVVHHTLQLLLNSGLDVCGLRLLYPTPDLLTNSTGRVSYGEGDDGADRPVLALAVRGPHARTVWQDVTGPPDPLLARKTDPASINALHCSSKNLTLLYSPRLASRVHRELVTWFAGRVPGDNSQNPDQAPTDSSAPGDGEGSSPLYITMSSTTLCATVKVDVFLVVSPAVASCCYSQVLSVCEGRGFSLRGVQRLQLPTKRIQALGLTSQQVSVFCSPPTVTVDEEKVELSPHCLVLLLRRESGLRHCASLPAALVKELEEQRLLGCIHIRLSDEGKLDPSSCFHMLPYSESLLHSIGGRMWAVPDPCSVVLSKYRCPSNPELEQVVVLTLAGRDIGQGLSLLHRLLTGDTTGEVWEDGFELLALKWLPTLSREQAREVSPYEVGDRLWQSSLVGLTSSPALVCALRRVDAFATLRRLLPRDYTGNLNILMSPTPELAFRQASLFFSHGEMIPDHSVRPLLKFLPPPCINVAGSQCESLLNCMVQGPQPLVTLCLFKPGVWSHALGKILSKVQRSGFTVVGLRVLVLDTNTAVSLVSAAEHQDPSAVEAHVQYMSSGPSLALCLQRENAVKRLLDVLGPEDPAQARALDQFLWRACYSSNQLHSGIYGSRSYQRAVQDVKRLFPEGLCCTETITMRQEQIPSVHSDPLACLAREQSHSLAAVNKPSLSRLMASGLNGAGPLVRSALCQTTCLLLPSSVLHLGPAPLHLDLLEQLLGRGCHLVAGRMSVLDETQRCHIAETLMRPSERDGKITALPEGPCLIVVLQKDNVVTCFDSMLESIYRERSNIAKVGKMLIYPSTEKKAVQLLCYLFDVLSPDSHHVIVPQQSEGTQML
ncbi:dynein axonemal assembly factor 8 isoform X3 [Coregonus clupeaformis]|uniref:dynein axonemal assembly factor 8 isoform X3 n=1 Tax=Coregonus clupeaformis TaxID=59861 RepID=UPI001BE0DA93|nr:dynein axonemal assembly factor 8 isoform X3 [Coregonus clupeaformis]